MKINLIVCCPECDREISHSVSDLSEDEIPKIDVMQLEQINWYCPDCKITWRIIIWCMNDRDLTEFKE